MTSSASARRRLQASALLLGAAPAWAGERIGQRLARCHGSCARSPDPGPPGPRTWPVRRLDGRFCPGQRPGDRERGARINHGMEGVARPPAAPGLHPRAQRRPGRRLPPQAPRVHPRSPGTREAGRGCVALPRFLALLDGGVHPLPDPAPALYAMLVTCAQRGPNRKIADRMASCAIGAPNAATLAVDLAILDGGVARPLGSSATPRRAGPVGRVAG